MFAPPSSDTATDNITETLLPDWVLEGARINIRDAELYYPDWIIRIHGVDIPSEVEEELVRNTNVELVRCKRFQEKARMMMSRFMVVDDPNVWFSIVRDLDSRFQLRELMATHEWIGKTMIMSSDLK